MNKKYIDNTINYYREYFIDDTKRPTIIIAAGGGYKYTSERESEPVAKYYNKNGFHAVVVNYRETAEDKYPLPQKYLASAMKEIKNDKRVSKMIGLGFSAGGHCMLELTVHSDNYGIKPDLLVLAYPVVTSNELYSHKGSFENLIDYNDKKLLEYLSLEKEIHKDMPDLFLWHTFTDESVNVMNSLLLLESYKKNDLNAEFHMFPLGGHGLSLANKETSLGDVKKEIPYITSWIDYSIKWLYLKLK